MKPTIALLLDTRIWWERLNSERIPIRILGAIILGFRIYQIYRQAKAAPQRSPKVRRIEVIIAVSLWVFIAVVFVLLLLFKG